MILQFYELLIPEQVFSCGLCEIFQENYSSVHLWAAAPVDTCCYKKAETLFIVTNEVLLKKCHSNDKQKDQNRKKKKKNKQKKRQNCLYKKLL